MPDSKPLRDRVSANVETHGWHYYRIYGGPTPPWSYTIGLHRTAGAAELVLAGSLAFTEQQVHAACAFLAERAGTQHPSLGDRLRVPELGDVTFGPVDNSWKRKLLLGALDFYEGLGFPALQVTPTSVETLDAPDMSRPVADASTGPWQWLEQPWPYEIPERAQAFTDLLALRGNPVTMIIRNPEGDETEWEAWATHEVDIPRELARLAPLGTLLALDPTIAEMLQLRRGEYGARDFIGDDWRVYGSESG